MEATKAQNWAVEPKGGKNRLGADKASVVARLSHKLG
jgi:hypothetical protein